MIRENKYLAATMDGYPTTTETDEYGQYTALTGPNWDAGLSLRKSLILGCHEIVAVDDSNTVADSVLIHIRGNNKTLQAYIDETAGATQFITPQGICFTTDASLRGSAPGTVVGNYTGSKWGGGLPTAGSATTGGAGATSYGWGQTDITLCGGIWDTYTTGTTTDLLCQHFTTRVNWNSSNGLQVKSNSNLGYVNNIVFCGPAMATGKTYDEANNGYSGFLIDDTGGVSLGSEVGVVGWDKGFSINNNSSIRGNKVVASGNNYGFYVNNNSNADIMYSLSTGNVYDGYMVRDGSYAEANNSISVCNNRYGFYINNDSYMQCPSSLSCFNAGHGFYVTQSSQLQSLGKTTITESLHTRFGMADSSGTRSYRNNAGFRIDYDSNAQLVNAISSYNDTYGFHASYNSTVYGSYSCAWHNGLDTAHNGTTGHRASSLGVNSDGYKIDHFSNMYAPKSFARANIGDGFFVDQHSYIDVNGSSAEGNMNGFNAFNGSQIFAEGAGSSGNTLHGFIANMNSLIDATDTFSFLNGSGTDGITSLGGVNCGSATPGGRHGGSGDYASLWHSKVIVTGALKGVTGTGYWSGNNLAGGSTLTVMTPHFAGSHDINAMGATYSGASGANIDTASTVWY